MIDAIISWLQDRYPDLTILVCHPSVCVHIGRPSTEKFWYDVAVPNYYGIDWATNYSGFNGQVYLGKLVFCGVNVLFYPTDCIAGSVNWCWRSELVDPDFDSWLVGSIDKIVKLAWSV